MRFGAPRTLLCRCPRHAAPCAGAALRFVGASCLDDRDKRVFHGRRAALIGARAAANLGGRALRQHPAGVHDRDAIAVFRFFHEVRGHHHGDALLGERGDAAPKLAPRQRIGAAGRLVEKQQSPARATAPPPSPGAA